MSAVIAQVNISSLLPKPKPVNESVVIGKDVLELLAGSMYVDPLNIYREYIQNAADSIDEAREQDLDFEQSPGISISFDHGDRVIKIRDNGCSIPTKDFARRLIAIGGSRKRGGQLRGFRGVGRLSGLGYCQELIFRGRADGDSKVTEIRWDGRALREKMRDQKYVEDLATLIKDVVSEVKISGDGFPNRFFEVELRKISRLRNDILLNEESVRSYISQVAPVPFSNTLKFATQIDTELELNGVKPPIHIELNDGNGPVIHRLQDHIKYSDTVSSQIQNIEFVELKGMDGETCAIGWVADHPYSGSIPKRLGLGGIRLRAGNIQIGEDSILSNLFPESRFSGWAIGDIHVISPKIMPNGRRDDFEPSASYAHLQSELSLLAKKIAQRIRERSAQRNQVRNVQQHLNAVDSWIKVANNKKLPSIILQIVQDLSQERLNKVVKENEKLNADSNDRASANKRLKKLNSQVQLLSTKGQIYPAQKKISGIVEKSITAAVKTILSNSKTPDSGILLSLEVLAAIETAI